MYIKYRDNLGYVIEKVDEYGLSCDGQYLLFNDKRVACIYVEGIQETKTTCNHEGLRCQSLNPYFILNKEVT